MKKLLGIYGAQYGVQGIALRFVRAIVLLGLVREGLSPSEKAFFVMVCGIPWGFPKLLIWGPMVDFSRRFAPHIVLATNVMVAGALAVFPLCESSASVLWVAFALNVALSLQDVATDGSSLFLLPEKDVPRLEMITRLSNSFGAFLGGTAALWAKEYLGYTGVCFTAAFSVVLFGVLPALVLCKYSHARTEEENAREDAGEKNGGGVGATPLRHKIFAPVVAIAVYAFVATGFAEAVYEHWFVTVFGVEGVESAFAIILLTADVARIVGTILGGVLGSRRGISTGVLVSLAAVCGSFLVMGWVALATQGTLASVGFLVGMTTLCEGAYKVKLYALLRLVARRGRAPATEFAAYMAITNFTTDQFTMLSSLTAGLIGFPLPAMFIVGALGQLLTLLPLRAHWRRIRHRE